MFSPVSSLVASLSTLGSNDRGSGVSQGRALGLSQPKLRKCQTFLHHEVPDEGTVNKMDVSIVDFIHSNSLSFALMQ